MAYSSFYAKSYDRVQYFFRLVASAWSLVEIKIYLAIIFILQAFSWFQAIDIYKKTESDLLILHYNIDFGIDLIGDPAKIFYFPIAGLLISLINFLIISLFIRKSYSKLFSHLFLGATILFNVFLILGLLAIYLINFK